MAKSAANTHSRRHVLRRVLLALLGLAGIGGVLAILLMLFGTVAGEEFCPQTFQRRTYWLVELPLVHWPLSREHRQPTTGACEQELARRSWIATTPSGAVQWHLAWQQRGRQKQTGDAAVLLTYLDSRDEEEELRWLRWSQAHPELARRLWPAVQQLAIQGQYVWIPDLFLLARQHSDPARFDKALQSLLAQAAADSHPPPAGQAPSGGSAADSRAGPTPSAKGSSAPPPATALPPSRARSSIKPVPPEG
jgi:hypothetical protein